ALTAGGVGGNVRPDRHLRAVGPFVLVGEAVFTEETVERDAVRAAWPCHVERELCVLHHGQASAAAVGDGRQAGVVGGRRGAGERRRAAEGLLDAGGEGLPALRDEGGRHAGDALLAAEEAGAFIAGGGRHAEERDEGDENGHVGAHSVRRASPCWPKARGRRHSRKRAGSTRDRSSTTRPRGPPTP